MRTSDIKRLGEAYASVVESSQKEDKKQFQFAAMKAKEDGKTHFTFAGKKYECEAVLAQMKEDNTNDKEDDGEGMDKVQPKALKKKFKDRKDKDIDNDGDVDGSDEYLHKKRKAVSKAIDKDEDAVEDEPTDNEKDAEDEKKKDKKKVAQSPKTAEISKIGEATEELLAVLETAAKQQKSNAVKPEGLMDKESPKSKEFADKHKVEVTDEEETHDTATKAGQATKAKSGKRPQDNQAGDKNVVKSTEAPVKEEVEEVSEKVEVKSASHSLVDAVRAQLAGELKTKEEKKDNPYDGRLKTAKEFLNRMSRK